MSSQVYQDIRIVVVRENWLGCTGLSAFEASLRAGARASSLSEGEYVPVRWRSFGMRAAGKVLRGIAVREFNHELLAETARRKADLLLVFKGPFVAAQTLRAIRGNGTRCYCFYPDVSFQVHGPYLPHALREYDWIFTTKTFGLKDMRERLGVTSASFLPHAFDPVVHRPRVPTLADLEMYGCDVSFIGTWSPKKEALLGDLVSKRPHLKIKVWGNQWEKMRAGSALRRAVQFKPVEGFDYAMAIHCSKVNLAILSEQRSGASSGDLITSRTFHIPASGGLMLHERTPDLMRYFAEGRDCACFYDNEELIERVDLLLRDDILRRRLCEQGRSTVERAHSWDHRISTIFDHFLSESETLRAVPPQARAGVA